jgi:acetyltransferase
MSEPEKSAGLLSKAAESLAKPLLASWMGGSRMQLAADVLNESRIPTFEYPDDAARSFAYMWRYSSNLMALYETPVFTGDLPQDGPQRVARIIADAQKNDRVILTEHESKQILEAYDLPTTPLRIARAPEEAVAAAETMGYPVVLKLHSERVTHKSDRGGVQLNLENASAVRAAFAKIQNAFPAAEEFLGVTVQPMIKTSGYELIVGSSTDPQFGPVMVFGVGGQLVEIVRDRTHALPPLTTTLARRMMENTHVTQALKGVRGRKPVDLEKLEELVVRFSELVIENPRIADIEINPLLAGTDVLLALDARVILHPGSVADSALPRPAIRPYPTQYISTWQSADGTKFAVRPIRPDDEPLMVDFHRQLSETSVYMRYFLPLKLDVRVAHERLFTKCFIDYDREMALVAEYTDNGSRHLAGIARMIRAHSVNSAEVAFLVADKFQHRGLGTYLLDSAIGIARKEGIATLEATTLSENFNMKDMFVKAGFRFSAPEDGVVTATLRLS